MCKKNYLTSDENTRLYTGQANVSTFTALLQYLKLKAERMKYWQGNDTSVRTDIERGRHRKLTLENELFAVLVRIKLFLEERHC